MRPFSRLEDDEVRAAACLFCWRGADGGGGGGRVIDGLGGQGDELCLLGGWKSVDRCAVSPLSVVNHKV